MIVRSSRGETTALLLVLGECVLTSTTPRPSPFISPSTFCYRLLTLALIKLNFRTQWPNQSVGPAGPNRPSPFLATRFQKIPLGKKNPLGPLLPKSNLGYSTMQSSTVRSA